MFATALIVFREVLEAALVVGIVMAASRGIARRGAMVSAGITAGLAGAVLVAAMAGKISQIASGMGQEILNASILGLAVLMLGWHNVWMSQHGREIAQHMNAVGKKVATGAAPVWLLGTAIALAVLREGSEVVLFLYGIAAGGANLTQMLSGGAVGLMLGASMGALMYFGLLRVPLRHFFTATSAMILLLAAGLASQSAGFLVQAGLVPPLAEPLWDSSAFVADGSLPGKLLQALMGYTARPAGIQVLIYIVTLLVIGGLMKFTSRPHSTRGPRVSAVIGIAAVAGLLSLTMQPRADAAPFKVYSPRVVKGENEIEYRGYHDFDKSDSLDGGEKQLVAVGRGFTDYWFSELYAVYEKEPGASLKYSSFEWENLFQLTESGKYWADFGLLTEYEGARGGTGNPDEIALAPIIEKTVDRWVGTVNLFFEQQVGSNSQSGTTFAYAARLKYLLNPRFEPAVEAFGEPGRINNFGPFNAQEHWVGPAFYGQAGFGGGKKLLYSTAILFGETSNSSDNRVVLRLEYEFF
jgi:FTR1 family protein